MLIEGRRDEQSMYQAKQIESKEPSDGETKKLEQQCPAKMPKCAQRKVKNVTIAKKQIILLLSVAESRKKRSH